MKLGQIERKLAALALDAACQNGELENSAVKFFILLKKRGIKIEEFDSNGYSADTGYFEKYNQAILDIARQSREINRLTAELSKRPVRFVHPRKVEQTGQTYESMPFGKHAGIKFEGISREYLEWAVRSITNNPDLVRSIKEYLERTK